jgi:hypothetical protein
LFRVVRWSGDTSVSSSKRVRMRRPDQRKHWCCTEFRDRLWFYLDNVRVTLTRVVTGS